MTAEYKGAYTGGRKPRNFGINQSNQGQRNNIYIKPRDRLVNVEKYDLEAQKLYCTDVKDGKKMIVHINPEQKAADEAYARAHPPETPYTGMVGYSIDKAMKTEYPAEKKSRLILKFTKVLKKDDGNGYAVVEASSIRGVPNKEDNKTFYALIGGRMRIDQDGNYCLARASIWDSIRKNGLAYDDDAGMEEMASMIEERNKNSSRILGSGDEVFRETLPVIGVVFRTLIDSGKRDDQGNPIMTEIGSSEDFDWMEGDKDEEGNVIKEQSHPLTGQEFLNHFDGYADWVKNNDYTRQLAENTPLEIEALFYESAPGSRNKNLMIGHKDNPKTKEKQLFKLCSTKSFLDREQTAAKYHDNMVVSGIIQFSGNKLEKIDGVPQEVQSFWVNNIHLNGISGHAHAFIRSSKGHKVELAPELKLQYQNKEKSADAPSQEYQQSAQAPVQRESAPVQHQAPVQEAVPAQANHQETDLGDDEDPFNFFEKTAAPSAPASESGTPRRRFSRANTENSDNS